MNKQVVNETDGNQEENINSVWLKDIKKASFAIVLRCYRLRP